MGTDAEDLALEKKDRKRKLARRRKREAENSSRRGGSLGNFVAFQANRERRHPACILAPSRRHRERRRPACILAPSRRHRERRRPACIWLESFLLSWFVRRRVY